MKKRMRTLMCLALVILLVVSITVPAMAVSESHSGVAGGYNYQWTATLETTYGTAQISTPTVPTSVTAQVQIETYYDLTGDRFGHDPHITTGYAGATAMDIDTLEEINGVPVRATVTGLKAAFKVGSHPVEDGHYMGTWYGIWDAEHNG